MTAKRNDPMTINDAEGIMTGRRLCLPKSDPQTSIQNLVYSTQNAQSAIVKLHARLTAQRHDPNDLPFRSAEHVVLRPARERNSFHKKALTLPGGYDRTYVKFYTNSSAAF